MSNNIVRLDTTNWVDFIKDIIDLQRDVLFHDVVGIVIPKLTNLMEHYSITPSDRFNDIKDSYQLMCNYMLKGYKDEHRKDLYEQIRRRLYQYLSDLILYAKLNYSPATPYLALRGNNTSLDIDSLRDSLESFVSDVAMLSLSPAEERESKSKALYEKRQNTVSRAFISILRSTQWSKEQALDMANLLLSPTIDTVDAQVLSSAVLMACLLCSDPYKVMALAKVYKDATDLHLKQRALVGWTLGSMSGDYDLFPEVKDYITDLLADEKVREDIVELQIQVVYCMGAEKDNETIQKDVMPTILKNQNIEVTRFGIKEKEEDPMDDILHSDEVEKRMEEMENTVQKMVDMQKRGVDIYFGGFSKMKRFGFFYTLCNWFMPFYTQHPGLSHLSSQMLNSGFMKALFKSGPFCDSDKYSFALGMSSVYEKLPANIREMLSNNEASLHVLGDSGVDYSNNPSYIRRFYLQDLYRFFRINDCRKIFFDPFSEKYKLFMANSLFYDSNRLHAEAQNIAHFLLKRKQYDLVGGLNDYFDESNAEDLMILARYYIGYMGGYDDAEYYYEKVLEMDSGNRAALKGVALASFACGHYDKALKRYRQLSEIYPEKEIYRLNTAISLINDDKAEEGIKILYELYYKHPEDIDVQRALAWGHLCNKNLEQASKLYNGILDSEAKNMGDFLNAGYCAWFKGDLEKAVSLFKGFVKRTALPKEKALKEKFDDDKNILDKYNIPDIDRQLMMGLAY